ncbi:DUF922 domain-containing protein [Aestuariivita sp.]|jgi:predicted secreted Zn-dependent protease|uniref:DUF922 domain-containing protein n=1 Tax=Aestuariivita sp. TaxID=1872407 RepID=UPI002173779E|nr:DUF922 domain-containing protein [Aestuariivita sp.]MCE8005544.1 DUF922 domain-containing Zn-dependent protease [Aestuariivita sp.]
MLRAAILACVVLAAPAVAEPRISETVRYYAITGDSFADLRRQMARKGQNGFWGYTRWWIEWSRRCEVDVAITIWMPRLDPRAPLSPQDRHTWDQMIEALLRHERLHAAHGVQAAHEIYRHGCNRPHRIIKKWADRDRLLDRETSHGAATGVRLPD